MGGAGDIQHQPGQQLAKPRRDVVDLGAQVFDIPAPEPRVFDDRQCGDQLGGRGDGVTAFPPDVFAVDRFGDDADAAPWDGEFGL